MWQSPATVYILVCSCACGFQSKSTLSRRQKCFHQLLSKTSYLIAQLTVCLVVTVQKWNEPGSGRSGCINTTWPITHSHSGGGASTTRAQCISRWEGGATLLLCKHIHTNKQTFSIFKAVQTDHTLNNHLWFHFHWCKMLFEIHSQFLQKLLY